MRQIKFRAWDKNSGKYIDLDKRHNGILYHQGELHISQGWDGVGLPTFYFSEDDINYHKRDCIFEQFTGLYDKDGKEIYEGDIVENINMTNKKHKNAVVEWAGHKYILRCLCGVVFNHGFENISISEIKVIGNIREEQK